MHLQCNVLPLVTKATTQQGGASNAQVPSTLQELMNT